MQRIFQEHQFTITNDEVGVGTTTITAPAGVTFFYYNPRFCENAEAVHEAIMRNDEGHAQTRMTAAGKYELHDWPFVLITKAQFDEIEAASMNLKTARTNLHDAEVTARLTFDKLRK